MRASVASHYQNLLLLLECRVAVSLIGPELGAPPRYHSLYVNAICNSFWSPHGQVDCDSCRLHLVIGINWLHGILIITYRVRHLLIGEFLMTGKNRQFNFNENASVGKSRLMFIQDLVLIVFFWDQKKGQPGQRLEPAHAGWNLYLNDSLFHLLLQYFRPAVVCRRGPQGVKIY